MVGNKNKLRRFAFVATSHARQVVCKEVHTSFGGGFVGLEHAYSPAAAAERFLTRTAKKAWGKLVPQYDVVYE